MTGLLVAEALKLGKRKLLWVLVVVAAILTALAAFLTLAAAEFLDAADLAALEPPAKPSAYLAGFSQAAGNSWVAVIIATVMLGAEFSKGTWSVALTWDPRRSRQLLARLVVYTAAALLIGLVVVAVWSLFVIPFAAGTGAPDLGEWLMGTAKLGLTQLVWIAIGLSAAALLRTTGLAVGLALAFTFVEQIISLWRPYQQISIQAASTGIFGLDPLGITETLFDFPEPAQAALVLSAWTAVAILVAWASLALRDA